MTSDYYHKIALFFGKYCTIIRIILAVLFVILVLCSIYFFVYQSSCPDIQFRPPIILVYGTPLVSVLFVLCELINQDKKNSFRFAYFFTIIVAPLLSVLLFAHRYRNILMKAVPSNDSCDYVYTDSTKTAMLMAFIVSMILFVVEIVRYIHFKKGRKESLERNS